MLGYEGEPIGPIDVRSLDGTAEAIEYLQAGRPTRFPDLYIAGRDSEAQKWLRDWAQTRGERREFVIRDNEKDRWLRVYGAFVRKFGDITIYPIVVTKADFVDGPFLD